MTTNNVVAMTQSDVVEAAQQRAREWLEDDSKRSQGDLATGTGRSRACISRWIVAKYDGDNAAVSQDVLQFIDRHTRESQASVVLKPVDTPTFKATTVALEMAMYGKRLGVIFGEPGCGKTFAAEQFVKRDPKGCLLVMCRYGLGTPKGFLAELIRILEGRDEEIYRQPSRMARQVIAHFTRRPRFLIVNDGQILRFPVFELLTALIEQCHIGVAVIGHTVMKDNITAGKRFDSETFDRVADFASFTRVSHRGVPRVIEQVDIDEIRGVVRQILPRATKDAIKFFADTTVFPSMRSVVNTAVDARGLLARKKGQSCDAAFIAQVLRLRRPEGF
ncbi:MAG: ATP-binding protein [Candidatus Lernaella stagnicola]|nr:ATP-binding protein [Candidatus Lernaella stagnicola]